MSTEILIFFHCLFDCYYKSWCIPGISLPVQGLGCFHCRGPGLIPGRGTRILQASQRGQKNQKQIMVYSYRSYLLPSCKWNHFNFYEDYRIYPMTALTFLHLDFKIPVWGLFSCQGCWRLEKELWSHPNNKRKLGKLQHHNFSWAFHTADAARQLSCWNSKEGKDPP